MDTDPTLASIPELHAVAKIDGQKTWSRRSISIAAVVALHVSFFLILLISRMEPPPEEILPSVETVLLLNPGKQNAISPTTPQKEILKPSGPPVTNAITLPPPLPRTSTQQEEEESTLGGLGRLLACEPGNYEYLAPSARAKCDQALVPWKLDPAAIRAAEQRRLQPVDPNKRELQLTGAELNRRLQEVGNGCIPSGVPVTAGPAADACQALHGGGPLFGGK